MSPGGYTELFFTDEATALAAGHRPCAECRRKAYNHFKQAWIKGNSHLDLPESVGVDFIDQILQSERTKSNIETVTYDDLLNVLPQGSYVSLKVAPGKAYLFWYGALWEWSPEGYAEGPKVTPTRGTGVGPR